MKNILGKLHQIMTEVNYIQKDKRNTFHGYNYASEAAIKEKLHEAMTKHKVLFTFSVTGQQFTPVTTAKGNPEMLAGINCKYTFYDVENGEKLDGEFVGSGQDAGDKGTYKAITGAIKYILTSTFLIPTGDDAEDDSNEKRFASPDDTERTVSAVKVEYDQEQPGKICTVCGARHTGRYDKCLTCWKKDQKIKA